MKILVCGGRNYGHVVRTKGETKDEPPETQERLKEYRHILNVLGELTLKHSNNCFPDDITIITGGAKGADRAACDFAVVYWTRYEEYKARLEKIWQEGRTSS